MSEMNYYTGKKILITGGLGFIGSTLAIRLIESGAEVTLLDALIPDLGANSFNIEPIKDRVAVVQANLGDRSVVDDQVKGKDLIFNIGMHSCHLRSMSDPLFDLETNVIPQVHFLEALRAHNPQTRIIYIGTRAQYGQALTIPITENTPPNPKDIYAASKQVVEWYHLLYQKICGLRATSLRLGNTYGPRHQMRHPQYGVQNFLIRLALEDQEIKVFGDGIQKREMIYIDDIISCLLLLGENPSCVDQIYSIGSAESITFLQLVQEIIRACGSGRYVHVPWPEDRKTIEVGDVVTDFSKLTAHTGWKPSTLLAEGLNKTVAFYRQYRGHYWL
ncbi:MAG: GDP-mannose 4,6-dehydratase [Deltaproteobacteria bacterium]|nr:GDP-mannose 4,6-dehydratase [Deltaproteobacteria bacterium]